MLKKSIQYIKTKFIVIKSQTNQQYQQNSSMLSKVIKRCFSTSGSLLTWGETTYGWGRTLNNKFYSPDFVDGFNNVTHAATGPYHLAFLTNKNQVYTVGYNNHGQLGNGSTNTAQTPVKVDIQGKVKQLACGQRHTLALTDDGNVWAWGYGGRSPVFGCSLFGIHNPLGVGFGASSSTPVKVGISNIQQISAGKDFSLAVAGDKVWGWGEGLIHLTHNPSSYPVEFSNASVLCESKKTKVKKVASIDGYAMFLLENGKLYAIGKNIGGATATRHNEKIITDNDLMILTKINDHPIHGEKIVDFEISANSLIFTTQSGHVFYSGMHSKFAPTPFPAHVQASSIWATENSVGIIGTDGKVYFINDAIIEDHDKVGQVFVSDDANLKGAFKIGGSHLLRYALRA